MPLGGAGGGLTAAPYAVHTEAGSFTDTFTFNYAGNGWVDASLITVFAGQSQQISFSDAWLNGVRLDIDAPQNGPGGTTWISASLPQHLLAGDYTLVVKGYAGGGLAAGTTGISASYSGTFNVAPAVPEPQSYAMFLGGLALVTVMLGKRRRRQ